MHEEISYDRMIDEFVESRKDESETIWRQAAICFFLRVKMGVPAKTIGGDVGLSGKYVGELAKTFEAFPEADTRAADMTFSVHKVCAQQDDPVGWLDRAVEHAWSVRELKEAIKGDQPDTDPAAQAESLWKRVEAVLFAGGPAGDYLVDRMVQFIGRDADLEAGEEKEEAPEGV